MTLTKDELELLKEIVDYNVRVYNEEYEELGEDDLITFPYEEFDIHNPFVDESDRFEVEPIEYYGEESIMTMFEKYAYRQMKIIDDWKQASILNTTTISELDRAVKMYTEFGLELPKKKKLSMASLSQDLGLLKGWNTGHSSKDDKSILVERDGQIYKLTVEHVDFGEISHAEIKKHLN